MSIMRRTIPLLLALLVLTGCANVDDGYLTTVRGDIPALAEVEDAELVDIGKGFCATLTERGFDDGMSSLIDSAASAGLNADNLGDLVRASVPAYCPEFQDEL